MLGKKELEKLIEERETETLELKPGLSQLNEIVETISALANKKEGKGPTIHYTLSKISPSLAKSRQMGSSSGDDNGLITGSGGSEND